MLSKKVDFVANEKVSKMIRLSKNILLKWNPILAQNFNKCFIFTADLSRLGFLKNQRLRGCSII